MKIKPWTDADLVVLRAAVAAGKSSRACSRLLGGRYSSVSCINRAAKEGLRFSCGSGGASAVLTRKLQRGALACVSKVAQTLPVFPETVEFIGLQNDVPSDRKTCRAIAGHPAVEAWQYCGHPVMSPKISYCAVHAERFYNKAYLERLR